MIELSVQPLDSDSSGPCTVGCSVICMCSARVLVAIVYQFPSTALLVTLFDGIVWNINNYWSACELIMLWAYAVPGAHNRKEQVTAHEAKFRITLPTFNKLAFDMFPYKEVLEPRYCKPHLHNFTYCLCTWCIHEVHIIICCRRGVRGKVGCRSTHDHLTRSHKLYGVLQDSNHSGSSLNHTHDYQVSLGHCPNFSSWLVDVGSQGPTSARRCR